MNKIILTGRPTNDPEIRIANRKDGSTFRVGEFSLANNNFKKRDKTADFFQVRTFDEKIIEFLEKHVKKGSLLEVSGYVETGSYTNKEGRRVATWTVMAEEINFSGDTRKSGGTNANATAQTGALPATEEEDEELPIA